MKILFVSVKVQSRSGASQYRGVDLDVDTVMEEEMEGRGDGHGDGGEGDMDTVMEMEASLSRAFDLTQGWALIKVSLQGADHPEEQAARRKDGAHALCCL